MRTIVEDALRTWLRRPKVPAPGRYRLHWPVHRGRLLIDPEALLDRRRLMEILDGRPDPGPAGDDD